MARFFLNIYSVFFRPTMGYSCKYHPSCSCYAKQSFEKHNFLKAIGLTTWRIIRCNPLSRGGYDPVPEAKK